MIIYGLDSLKGINHSSTYNNRRSVTDFIHTISQQISNENNCFIKSVTLSLYCSTQHHYKHIFWGSHELYDVTLYRILKYYLLCV